MLPAAQREAQAQTTGSAEGPVSLCSELVPASEAWLGSETPGSPGFWVPTTLAWIWVSNTAAKYNRVWPGC